MFNTPSTHIQSGNIHTLSGTAEMIITDRTDGVSHVRGTEIRLPIQFKTRPVLTTTVYSSDISFPLPFKGRTPLETATFRQQFSTGEPMSIWSVEIQNLGEQTQIVIHATNTKAILLSNKFFCDYIVIGETA